MQPTWEKRPHKMIATGMNVTVPPDLLPEGQFAFLQNVRVRKIGEIRSRLGFTQILTGFSGAEVHSIKRFLEDISATELLIVGAGTGLYNNTTLIVGDFSGYPLSFASEHPSESALSWMYIADGLKMVKVGMSSVGFVVQQWGVDGPGQLEIPPTEDNPAAVAAKPVVAATLDPGGELTANAPYLYKYLYRTDQGELSASSLPSDAVTVDGTNSNAVSVTLQYSPESPVFFIDVYRFGGTLNEWRRLPFDPPIANDSDLTPSATVTVTDTFSDLDLQASDVLPEENYRPWQSIDEDGNPIRRDLPFVWGPFQSVLMSCGDPARPGDIYWTIPGFPGGHALTGRLEITGPAEQLMNGFLWDGRCWVFSTDRLFAIYPNFAFPTVPTNFDALETPCGHGLWAPWSFCTGDAIYFLSKDGIYRTDGGAAVSITDEQLYPLFPHEDIAEPQSVTINGVTINPPNMRVLNRLRLEYANGYVYFDYTGGPAMSDNVTLVYDTRTRGWSLDKYGGSTPIMHYAEEGRSENPFPGAPLIASTASERILMGTADGKVVDYFGNSDDGTAIACRVITAADDFGDPRAQKQYGDVFVEADTAAITVAAVPLFENATIIGPTTSVNTSGRANQIIDIGSGLGQLARNLQLDFSWVVNNNGPVRLYSWMPSAIVKPDDSIARMLEWHEFLPSGDDAYVMGIELWVDTSGGSKSVQVWADGVQVVAVPTLSFSTIGEEKLCFSWPAFKGRLGRLLPIDTVRWRVTKWNWVAMPEPLLQPDFDTNWVPAHAQAPVAYVTGIQIITDTLNVPKVFRLQSELESTVTNLVPTGYAGNPTLTFNGRTTISLAFTPFRANQLRLFTLDQVEGRLYEARWITHPEPPTLANWDSTFEDYGNPRIIKGVEIFTDTLNRPKTVRMELDGALHKTLTVQHNGRLAKTYPTDLVTGEFPIASTVRLLPTDTNQAYLYRVRWLAEDEPDFIRNFNTTWKDFGKDVLIKGVRIEANTRDAAGAVQTKTLTVQINLTDYQTLTISHDGRIGKNYDIAVGGSPSEYPRGRTVRLLPTDEAPGRLYSVEWIADEEPYQLANWNARWEDAGYVGAKFVQGFVVVADTSGQDKAILVEYDGGQTAETVTVNQNGRQGQPYSFNTPFIANQLRARPTDTNASWLYAIRWVYEPAPEAARVWETQGTSLGQRGFHHEKDAYIALISNDIVTLVVTRDGVADAAYTIPSTAGLYKKQYLPFRAGKEKVTSWRFTCPTAFRLFKGDCEVRTKAWGSDQPYLPMNPFGGPHFRSGAEI